MAPHQMALWGDDTMIYLTKERRAAIDAGEEPQNAGELSYKLTRVALNYMDTHERYGYQAVNDVAGALAVAQAEFNRRVTAPLLDRKRELNGDTYE